jgi:hypothetical protein
MLPFFYLVGVSLSREWSNPRIGLRVSPEEEIFGPDHGLHDVISEKMAREIMTESKHFLRHTMENRDSQDGSLADSEERDQEEGQKVSSISETPRELQPFHGPTAKTRGPLLITDI